MRGDFDYPLVVCSRLVFCEVRQTYRCTWHKVPAKWLRKKSDQGPVPWWKEWEDMKRYMSEATKVDKKWKAPQEPMLAKRPHLAQLLTDPWWEDGSPREVCYLTVRIGLESVQISLNDPENEASATTTGESLDDALALLEGCFEKGKSPWRKWGGNKKRK